MNFFRKRASIFPCPGVVTPLLFSLLLLPAGSAYGEVTTEISPSGNTLVSPDGDSVNRINISGGRVKGGNLFHSFEKFSIGKDHAAYFRNISSQPIENIITHVTGGLSKIDGEISSREYGNANLFLINPAGMVFGAGAKLEVGGSFYATTAETIQFQDGSTFSVNADGENSLSSAPVTAFGFLDNASAITVDGARLEIGEGQVLSMSAGNITIDNGATLKANGGEIKLLSRANADGVMSIDGTLPASNGEYTDLGKVTLREGSVIRGTGDGSSIQIQAEALLIEGNRTKIKMKNSGDKGRISIDLSDTLLLTDGGGITTAASGGNTAANIEITVRKGNVVIAGISKGGIPTGSEINSSATGGGRAGDISIVARNSTINIDDGGTLRATSSGFGSAAKAGDINLTADRVSATNGGQIINRASGNGSGGAILIRANTVEIEGEEPGIQSETTGIGDAGNILILPGEKNLVIKGSGTVSANSTSEATGNAGNIAIGTTGVDVLITDGIKISALTSATGKGGNITVNGRKIDITNGANLTAESQSEAASSPSDTGNTDSGKSGSISIRATDSFLLDHSQISLNTRQTDAGDIVIRSGRLFRMSNQSTISTSVADGRGNGGDISINEDIDSNLVVLGSSSEIRANARKGAGGNISIKAYSHLISSDSTIDASAGSAGIDGSVTVTTPDVDATTGILQLPESFLDASALLSSRCSTRTTGNSSSFVIESENNMTTPDNLLTGSISYLKEPARSSNKSSTADSTGNSTLNLLSKKMAGGCW